MTIKFLIINSLTKVKHITQSYSLYDIEVIQIDCLNIKISELKTLNLPINLKHLILDLNIKEEEDKYKDVKMSFDAYEDAINYINKLVGKFKIPIGCILTFRFDCKIEYIKGIYYDSEFIYSNNSVIYGTYINNSYMGKVSKSHVKLNKIIDEELKNI